jgi:hypothetical protein
LPRRGPKSYDIHNRSLRAAASNLDWEKDWWLQGAYDENGVPLRDANLSDSAAATYWDRVLGLVAFVDQSLRRSSSVQEGDTECCLGSITDYLQIAHISEWFSWYSNNHKIVARTGASKPYSAAYLQTLAKVVKALARAFILPALGGGEGAAGQKYLGDVSRILAKCVADIKRQPKQPQEAAIETKDGLVYLERASNTLDAIKARLLTYEEKTAAMEKLLGAEGRKKGKPVQLLRLQIAERKQAILASSILLWHLGRVGDIRHVVVNWDLRQTKCQDGKLYWIMDPAENKTKWRQ